MRILIFGVSRCSNVVVSEVLMCVLVYISMPLSVEVDLIKCVLRNITEYGVYLFVVNESSADPFTFEVFTM